MNDRYDVYSSNGQKIGSIQKSGYGGSLGCGMIVALLTIGAILVGPVTAVMCIVKGPKNVSLKLKVVAILASLYVPLFGLFTNNLDQLNDPISIPILIIHVISIVIVIISFFL